jgi:hypothetical protein
VCVRAYVRVCVRACVPLPSRVNCPLTRDIYVCAFSSGCSVYAQPRSKSAKLTRLYPLFCCWCFFLSPRRSSEPYTHSPNGTLPNEVVDKICSYLETVYDVVAVAGTCRSWRQIVLTSEAASCFSLQWEPALARNMCAHVRPSLRGKNARTSRHGNSNGVLRIVLPPDRSSH